MKQLDGPTSMGTGKAIYTSKIMTRRLEKSSVLKTVPRSGLNWAQNNLKIPLAFISEGQILLQMLATWAMFWIPIITTGQLK